ncbi:MAG: ATP-binding protein [Legionellaceae bacterium]|nr:ATP-binding protein [Legionellaceae bacterium]
MDRIFLFGYLSAGTSIYQSEGNKGIKNWLAYLKKTEKVDAYFIIKNKTIIGQDPISEDVEQIFNQFNHNELPQKASKLGYYVISGSRSKYASDVNFRLITDSRTMAQGITPATIVFLELMFALVVSLISCLFLSNLLINPILIIKKAVHQISRGKLDVRISDAFKNRNDELVELAKNFDNMAQELQSLVSSKERLLEDISHELRSPLARQMVAIELLKAKSNDLSIKHFQYIMNENKKLNQLIDEIISLAKIKSHTRILQLTEVNLCYLLQKIAEDANYECQQNCIKVKCPHDLSLQADVILLNRAIENIIRNAVRYTGSHKEIEIKVSQQEDNLIMSITDNGPGVPEDEIAQIFEVFYRAHTASVHTSGYGLGLSIAKQAIQLHRGTIQAHNLARGGLQVDIVLPQRQLGA